MSYAKLMKIAQGVRLVLLNDKVNDLDMARVDERGIEI